jgi:DNA end-binding protein Ku
MCVCESNNNRPVAESGPSSAAPLGTTGPRGRPSWSGLLRLSLIVVPVKAYPTVNSSADIHFNQLHANCGQRLKYEKRCSMHGLVEAGDIVRGFQYAPNQYVTVEPEEVEKLQPAKDKAIVLEQFIPAYQVDPVRFAGRSLYLMPDGVAANHPYGVLTEALKRSGKWAIGRVVLSGNRQLVSVRPVGRLLAMDLLHYPAEVRGAAAWETEIRAIEGSPEELRLMGTLIDGAGAGDWAQYRDTTAEELKALIEAKIAGRPMTAPAEEPVAVCN